MLETTFNNNDNELFRVLFIDTNAVVGRNSHFLPTFVFVHFI